MPIHLHLTRTALRGSALWALLASSALASAAPAPDVATAAQCAVGSYRMADGGSLDIGPGATAEQLRWRLPDGRTGQLQARGHRRWASTLGWTDRADGHTVQLPACGSTTIRFDGQRGERIALVQTDTRFVSGGVTLAGRLTLPPGNGQVPIVVLVHGAEHGAALPTYSLQREFAAAGIGVFAYDKRGTGDSGGRYTQNYLTLANDAIHAARQARRLAGARAGRLGYQGGSQGGWVAPLAARIEPVDFVIVSFGLAVSPLDEDREAIAYDMARAGVSADDTAKAMEVADASAAIVGSGFTDGFTQMASVKARYGHLPWFKAVRGNISGYLLATPEATVRVDGPRLLEGVPADYDPLPVLEHLDVPQLWLLAGQDRDAPPGQTLQRLARLQRDGRPIQTAVFPDADHGMYDFERDAAGERVSTRQPDGYLRLMQDFILARPLAASYGAAKLAAGPRSTPP